MARTAFTADYCPGERAVASACRVALHNPQAIITNPASETQLINIRTAPSRAKTVLIWVAESAAVLITQFW